MNTIYVLSKNKKNIKIFLMKYSIFRDEKNLYILHGQVFVMMVSRHNFFMLMELIYTPETAHLNDLHHQDNMSVQ